MDEGASLTTAPSPLPTYHLCLFLRGLRLEKLPARRGGRRPGPFALAGTRHDRAAPAAAAFSAVLFHLPRPARPGEFGPPPRRSIPSLSRPGNDPPTPREPTCLACRLAPAGDLDAALASSARARLDPIVELSPGRVARARAPLDWSRPRPLSPRATAARPFAYRRSYASLRLHTTCRFGDGARGACIPPVATARRLDLAVSR